MKAQTAAEYMMMVSAAILFVTLVILAIRTGVFQNALNSANQSVDILKTNLSQVNPALGHVVAPLNPLTNFPTTQEQPP